MRAFFREWSQVMVGVVKGVVLSLFLGWALFILYIGMEGFPRQSIIPQYPDPVQVTWDRVVIRDTAPGPMLVCLDSPTEVKCVQLHVLRTTIDFYSGDEYLNWLVWPKRTEEHP